MFRVTVIFKPLFLGTALTPFCSRSRYSGDQVSGRGGGGHQGPQQQLLPGHQQEGGALRSGE